MYPPATSDDQLPKVGNSFLRHLAQVTPWFERASCTVLGARRRRRFQQMGCGSSREDPTVALVRSRFEALGGDAANAARLDTVDLSEVSLTEAKYLAVLCDCLCTLSASLKELKLRNCGLTATGIVRVCKAVVQLPHMTLLDLEQNDINPECEAVLAGIFTQEEYLKTTLLTTLKGVELKR
eukprot:scaffold7526_cov258-Pinguiococcus_pyrenoidosus.AAC.3